MPLYEYRCSDCGHLFERLQTLGADATGVTCPRCKAADPERQMSSFAAGGSKGGGNASQGGVGCGSGFT